MYLQLEKKPREERNVGCKIWYIYNVTLYNSSNLKPENFITENILLRKPRFFFYNTPN